MGDRISMGWLKKYWLRISLICYFVVGLVCAQGIYNKSHHWFQTKMMEQISPKPDQFINMDLENLQVIFKRENAKPWESETISFHVVNVKKYEMYHYMDRYCNLVIYGAAILFTSFLFYRRRLKKGLDELKTGFQKIEEKSLDFQIQYRREDEIGALCEAYDQMRQQLKVNFELLWETQRKQQQLYQTFAHDLRTPLTIIRGNTELMDMIINEMSLNKNKEEIEDFHMSVENIKDALKRIELYVKMLKELRDMEDWVIEPADVNGAEFKERIVKQYEMLAQQYQKQIRLEGRIDETLSLDEQKVTLVLDKLIENGLRFAKRELVMKIEKAGNALTFLIYDDGDGFSKEALLKGCDPFYTSDRSRGHIGMGLKIASCLAEKMGGRIQLNNLEGSGGKITFFIPV